MVRNLTSLSHVPPAGAPHGRKAVAPEPFTIRTFHDGDQAAASRLYHDGLLTGQLDPCDRAADLEHVTEVYLKSPRNRFWVAEADGLVIGTVGILQDSADGEVAHVRRLRVAPDWQHEPHVAGRLLQTATAHARNQGFLKLALHTPVDDDRARALLERLGFVFARQRQVRGRAVLEFYRQLYRLPGALDRMELDAWRLV
jgi:N-acetylglutamate synthase-like GNAT family acetyltransferase